MNASLKVLVACSGLGRARRGYESFADECFDALRGSEHITPSLIHGPGAVSRPGETAAWLIPYLAAPVQAYARLRARGDKFRQHFEAFTVEQYSFGLSVARYAAKRDVDVILFSESTLGVILQRLRRWFGLRYRMIFSNGGPWPPPFPFCDHVQHLTPYFLDLARRTGVPDAMQSLVPYGFAIPAARSEDKITLKRRLGLPANRPVIISVAAINRSHKRLDYLIDEVAALRENRPFVLFLGQLDDESDAIKARASAKLAETDFRFASVANTEIGPYYEASDLFVLSSVREAFGRVLVEATAHGLPCLVHDYPITRFVLGDLGLYADFTAPGALTSLLRAHLANLPDLERTADARRAMASARFGWNALLPAYERMFFMVAAQRMPA